MIAEQSQRLNKIIDKTLPVHKTRTEAVESLIKTLIIAESSIYKQTREKNKNYLELSANYVSHLLSGNDSLCERYKCRDALNNYKDIAEFYMTCVMDIKWLMDELYALRIVDLCRTGK